ncbi:MAG: hypothetical protein LBB56_05440 [Chitinispirillales bacterium]|jgi:hypothetical protein|nr:hypothetical protein [Chitinispirillales bacterium]
MILIRGSQTSTFCFACAKTAVLLLCLFSVQLFSIEYRIAVESVLDNREYGDYPSADGTFFFVRNETEAGVTVDEGHQIRGGFSYMQEFGAPRSADNFHLLLYYQYRGDNVFFRMGSFPRASSLVLPDWFFCDSAAYFRPFIHGAVVDAVKWNITFNAWADWTSRQTDEIRETFLFGGGMRYNYDIFFAKQEFIMFHRAAPGVPIENDHVWDNGGLSGGAGVSFRQISFIDSVILGAGGLMSLDRYRGDGDWHTPKGGYINAQASKSFFTARGFFYNGKPQRMRFWGDSFYTIPTFGRLDLAVNFTRRQAVRADFFQSLHFSRGHTGYSQHFILNAEIGGSR